MKNKDVIKLINEEISDYDFLNNNEYVKEKESSDLLLNEDFQKQFIVDVVLKRNNIKINVTDARITGDWENNDSGTFGVEYYVEIIYSYDKEKEPAEFILNFNGDSMEFNANTNQDSGDNITAPHTETDFNYVNWLGVDVQLHTFDGSNVNFTAFDKTPDKVKNIFIREFLEGFIENKTGQNII